MKRFATALGICALLLGTQAAVAIDWQGDDWDYPWDWGVGSNWNGGNVPNSSGESASITTKTTSWPTLDQNYTTGVSKNINQLYMSNDAQLNVSTYSLDCATFLVPIHTTAEATVTVTGSGTITASTSLTVQASASYDAMLTVSGPTVTSESVIVQGASGHTATLTASSGSVSTN